MRTWSRELRDVLVRAFAGLGLVLALAVLAAVLVSTAAQGDEKSSDESSVALGSAGGFGEGAGPKLVEGQDAEVGQSRSNPSHSGVALGVVILVGGIFVLGWGARRPRSDDTRPRMLQPASDHSH